MIDYEAPGRKSGLGGLCQRLRCGGVFGVTRGHVLEWVSKDGLEIRRCRECGQVMSLRDPQVDLRRFLDDA